MNLGENDVREMVRLVSEVADVPGSDAARKRFFIDGICRLIGADAWIWGLFCQREPDKPQVYVSNLFGGLNEERLVRLLEAIEHPEMIAIASRFFVEVKEKKGHLTRLRFQITDPAVFAASDAHRAWREAGIGPTILSLRPLDERSSSTVAFYRNYGRPEFSPRDCRVAHILLTEVPWLHEQGWPEDRGVSVPKLSRRQRLALNLLTLGMSRKAIAEKMRISPNTAHGYIRDLYQHFGVSSQAGLMKRFVAGNGGDI